MGDELLDAEGIGRDRYASLSGRQGQGERDIEPARDPRIFYADVIPKKNRDFMGAARSRRTRLPVLSTTEAAMSGRSRGAASP